jgi:hypothetical protein
MASNIWSAAIVAGTLFVAAVFLEFVLRSVLRAGTRILPDDICGPDGWLVDTTDRCGVFDRPSRR